MIKIFILAFTLMNSILLVGDVEGQIFTHNEFKAEPGWVIELSDNSRIAFRNDEKNINIIWLPKKSRWRHSFLEEENVTPVRSNWRALDADPFDAYSKRMVQSEIDNWEREKRDFEEKEDERFSEETRRYKEQKIRHQEWQQKKEDFEMSEKKKFEEKNNESYEEALKSYDNASLVSRFMMTKPEIKDYEEPAPEVVRPRAKELFLKPKPEFNRYPAYDFWGLVFYLSKNECKNEKFRVRFPSGEYGVVAATKKIREKITTTWGENRDVVQCQLASDENEIIDIFIDNGRFAGMHLQHSPYPVMVQAIISPELLEFEKEYRSREFSLQSMELRDSEAIEAKYYEPNTKQNLDLVYQKGSDGNPEVMAYVPKNFYLQLSNRDTQRIQKWNYFKMDAPEGENLLVLYRVLNLPVVESDLRKWDLIAQVEYIQHRGALHNILTYVRKEKDENQKGQASGVNYLFDGISLLYWPVWATLHNWKTTLPITFFDDQILRQNFKLIPQKDHLKEIDYDVAVIKWSLIDSNNQTIYSLYVGEKTGIIHQIDKPIDGHSYRLYKIDTSSIRESQNWREKMMQNLKIEYANPVS